MTIPTKPNIKAYHYTNPEAFLSMQDGRDYGKKGLLQLKRFTRLSNGSGLPDEAYEGVVEGLLEPEPESWVKNTEFPLTWNYLVHDFCKRSKTMLLSFDILPEDRAFVFERAYFERELYRKGKGLENSTKESLDLALRLQWESRVPAYQYSCGFDLPQLAIWNTIDFDRLNVVWVKPTREVWNNVLKQTDELRGVLR